MHLVSAIRMRQMSACAVVLVAARRDNGYLTTEVNISKLFAALAWDLSLALLAS